MTLIEWGDQIISALPKEHLEIYLEYGDNDSERVINISPSGRKWNERITELQQSLKNWEN